MTETWHFNKANSVKNIKSTLTDFINLKQRSLFFIHYLRRAELLGRLWLSLKR